MSEADIDKAMPRSESPEADVEEGKNGAGVEEGKGEADAQKEEYDVDAANTTISSGLGRHSSLSTLESSEDENEEVAVSPVTSEKNVAAENGGEAEDGSNVRKAESDVDKADSMVSMTSSGSDAADSTKRTSSLSSLTMRSASTSAERAFANIRRSRVAARTIRLRVSGSLVLGFLGICLTSQIMTHLCKWQLVNSSSHLFFSFTTTGYGLLLAVLPTDVLIIRVLTFLSWSTFQSVAVERAIFAWWVLQGNCPSMYQDDPVGCQVASATSVVQSVIYLAAAVWVCTTLRTKKKRFTMPARRALDRLWNVVRFALISIGLSEAFGYAISGAILSTPMPLQDLVGGVLQSVSFIFVSAMVTKGNRGRVLSWLGRLAVADEVRTASVVASLTSNLQSPLLMKNAVAHFKSIKFSSLCMEDFATNKCQRDLSTLSHRTRIGQADVFLSHSWHDPAGVKWSALRRWAQDFYATNGETPSIWLDKACIDQQNIDASLSCLPVYVAACKKLLVLAGPTYSFRLWCIMEIFTFLQMGGEMRNIEIYPLAADENGDAEEAMDGFLRQFAEFDTMNAQCFKDSDREHFLGIIEGAFGSTDSFNLEVQKLFTQRVSFLRRNSRIEKTPLADP